jgi:hypothetical protein
VVLDSFEPTCWRRCSPCWSAAESGRRETAPSLLVVPGAVACVEGREWCCCSFPHVVLLADQPLIRTWCSPSDRLEKVRLMKLIMEIDRSKGKVETKDRLDNPKLY